MFEGQTGRRIGQVLCRTVGWSAMQSSGLQRSPLQSLPAIRDGAHSRYLAVPHMRRARQSSPVRGLPDSPCTEVRVRVRRKVPAQMPPHGRFA